MIKNYFRPKTIDEASALFSRPGLPVLPLGGGTYLSRHRKEDVEVVDLQSLGLNTVDIARNTIQLGATLTLQTAVEMEGLPEDLRRAAAREAGRNIRNMATLGGTIASGGGTSPLLACFLALDAELLWIPGGRVIKLGEWLPLRFQRQPGFISKITIPTNVTLYFDFASRTPADHPYLIVAVACWPSGRFKMVVGGNEKPPTVIMDGPEIGNIEEAINNAYSHLINPLISTSYQLETGKQLGQRLLDRVKLDSKSQDQQE